MLPNQRSNFRRARFTTLGLQLHLDASLPATVIRDGSNFVSAWNDKSGAGRHMVQATQANKPQFQVTGLGGLRAIQFDGVDDFMTFSDQTLAYIAGRSFTIFYVASKPANNNTWVFGGTNTGTRTNLYAGNLTANTHRVGFYNDDQGSIVTAAASGITEIYTIIYDSSNKKTKDLISLEDMGYQKINNILEFPVTLMDAYLFSYMNISEEKIISTIEKTLNSCRQLDSDFNVMTILWHDNVLKMKGGRMYPKILEFLSTQDDVQMCKGIDLATIIDKKGSKLN